MSPEIEPRDERETQIGWLQALSSQAEGGDKRARAELRQAVAECSPAIIAEASNVARRAEKMLVETISAGEPLMQETLKVRLDHMRAELAGENPAPLERLLVERVVAGWLLVEVLEALLTAQFSRDAPKSSRVSPSYTIQMSKILESATRRHLAAIRTLAQIRKLSPAVQINIAQKQINTTG